MYKLTRCVWEITLACCFSCKYCGSGGGKAREKELSTSECMNLADELGRLGCERVSLIGGEVFMRKDWRQIIERLRINNINVNIITNGFLFTEEIINDLKKLRIESIAVSLDGPKEIHDKYRQEGSFDRAIRAIEILCEEEIPVSVISTLNRENSDSLEILGEIIKQYPVFAWQLQSCSPMGNASKNNIDYKYDFNKVIKFVEDNLDNYPFALGVADNIGYFTPSDGRIRGDKNGKAYFTGCAAGISSIGIDSIGNIRGCESMYDDFFIEGNIRDESLEKIWNNPDNFAYNRHFTEDMLTGKCAECELGGYCGGGCRSYNYFVHNKLYESPWCARNIQIDIT